MQDSYVGPSMERYLFASTISSVELGPATRVKLIRGLFCMGLNQ